MSGISAYMENKVMTQSKERLVVLLYDGAIKFLKRAIIELENKNYLEKGRLIGKAQDIILELNTTLDMEVGGEIAANLRRLYNFCFRYLYEANIQRDSKKIEQVIKILDELNQGWKAITA